MIVLIVDFSHSLLQTQNLSKNEKKSPLSTPSNKAQNGLSIGYFSTEGKFIADNYDGASFSFYRSKPIVNRPKLTYATQIGLGLLHSDSPTGFVLADFINNTFPFNQIIVMPTLDFVPKAKRKSQKRK